MRPWLVSKLSEELLGPAQGITECITSRPDLVYSVGILSPRKIEAVEEALNDQGLPSSESAGPNIEEGGDSSDEAPPAPWIDPTSKPSSMGLSLTCISNLDIPQFDVCMTYARYVFDETEKTFSRAPRAITLSWDQLEPYIVPIRKTMRIQLWLRPTNPDEKFPKLQTCEKDNAEVGLTITLRNSIRKANLWSVTFLLNTEIKPRPRIDGIPKWNPEADAELNIHQPEIRVSLDEGTDLDEYLASTSDESEDAIDAELYRGRGQRARGHLCSAVWKQFDPQTIENAERINMKTTLSDGDVVDYGESPPFAWTDRNHPFISNKMEPFYPPDARTEYLPMLNIAAPIMNPKWKDEPIFSAQKLSEANTPHLIGTLLQPLLDGYENWINQSFDPAQFPHHISLKSQATEALGRMVRGVELLKHNSDARKAFNFANKALEVNSQWTNDGNSLNWRKFQLSFALSVLESTTNRNSPDREHLDLLWVATGGGKTEAYLLVTAYILAYRRLGQHTDWHGVSVLTRYTLRLLTIQQFRRALGIVTAMEWLRNKNELNDQQLNLGVQPFSIGIWVGSGVTPNKLSADENGRTMLNNWRSIIKSDVLEEHFSSARITAIQSLAAGHHLTNNRSRKSSEPAQILNCPSCKSALSFTRETEDTTRNNEGIIHWVIKSDVVINNLIEDLIDDGDIPINNASAQHHYGDYYTLSLDVTMENGIHEISIENLWTKVEETVECYGKSISICSTRASRPGYYFRTHIMKNNKSRIHDFEIRCPNPKCELNMNSWSGNTPAGSNHGRALTNSRPPLTTQGRAIEVIECWRVNSENATLSRGTPIPAYTVDQQIYRHLPSIVISTVDKFARLSFEPKTGGLFGNITHHHEISGFVRAGAGEKIWDDGLSLSEALAVEIPSGLESPELIIQDELHLIEGPLGSMVGYYETVIEELIREGLPHRARPKYIASTATIRAAEDQIKCLFDREVHLFPPKGPNWKDRGLIVENDSLLPHDKAEGPGRLYLGFCPIGVSGLGVQRDVFTNLLHNGSKIAGDRFWSIVGYFNAVRELAGGRALVEQDIVGKLNRIAKEEGIPARPINAVELSSRMVSSDLPILLDQLEGSKRGESGCIDVLLTTSMFGTGVDVDRLNIMFVGGQPKTTAQYIQATGRVGRDKGAIVATYLRGSRPRDLDHYERFLSYHLQLHRYVEPVTVRPYSFAVLERAAGPLSVAWLRNSRLATTIPWRMETAARRWKEGGVRPPEFDAFKNIIINRNHNQSPQLRIVSRPPNAIASALDKGWDKWGKISYDAEQNGNSMQWVNNYNATPPQETFVVLGDERHVRHPDKHRAAYSPDYPAPQSLRSVDSTIGVQTRRD